MIDSTHPPQSPDGSPEQGKRHRQDIVSFRTEETHTALRELRETTQQLLPLFGEGSWNKHNLVTLNVTVLSRLLYLNDLYRKIVDVPGVICEFGVQWGSTLTQLINLRSIYEPFNHSRIIYGFDTFSGFPSVNEMDGNLYRKGDLATPNKYEDTLDRILALIESFPPLPHIKKFALIKGDASHTIEQWLDDNPHAIISLAIFDMDLYSPTKAVLEKIMPRLTKGSIIAFDELNCKAFPGETRALDEVIGLNNLRLRRSPLHPHGAWAVIGE